MGVGVLACSLVALVLAGPGGRELATTLQDDALLLHRPAAQVRDMARQIAALGVSDVRITAGWSALSPQPRSPRMPPAPFDPSDSATYPRGAFSALDTAVKAAGAAGLRVGLDVAFWAPRWAVRRHAPNGRARRWPDPRLFGAFATAVARRYSGAFPDPAAPRRALPAVRLFTPWNEPNHPSFLAPQWVRAAGGRWRAESPHVYRALYLAAHAAIKAVSPLDRVLIGGTASTGSTVPGRGGVAPLEFVRALACVDDRLRPLVVPECRGFTALPADGYAHHPYSRTSTPDAQPVSPDDAPLGGAGRLTALLDALAARGRIAGPLSLYDTEYGYESREDDPFAPFDRATQAGYLSWATYLAWRDPRTAMFGQFLLRDIDPRDSGRPPGTRGFYRDWQTGLFDARGEPKPAAQAFALPFWAEVRAQDGAPPALVVWGMVRPHRGAETVRVEQRSDGGQWTPVATYGPSCDRAEGALLTDRQGVFERALPVPGAPVELRFAWRHGSTWDPSEPVRVDPSLPVAVAPAT